MILVIISRPFLGSALAGLMGRWLGARGRGIVTIRGLFTRMIFSYLIFYEIMISGSPIVISLSSWFSAHTVSVDWLQSVDRLTRSMMVTVSTVSFCVHIYSQGYMQRDPHLPRFFSYQSLFTGSMQLQVRANDLVTLQVGWEMIGVCSYLQIGFWFHRQSRTKAAQKAMQVNRVSDTILLIGQFYCWWYLGSTDTTLIRAVRTSAEYSDLICLFLQGGALGKSAQVGLHVWLADAMEGFFRLIWVYRFIYQIFLGVYSLLYKYSFNYAGFEQRIVFTYSPVVSYGLSAPEGNHYFSSSAIASKNEKICFTKFEIGVVVGLMLRDGSQSKGTSPGRNKRLAICIRRNVQYYLNWLHCDQLKRYYTRTPPCPYLKENPTQYSLHSRSLPVFTEIYDLWYTYKNGKSIKKVPTLAYQKKNFNEVSLAHWIMNDGYWDGTVILCTESFSKKKMQRLIKQLFVKYGLVRTTKKRYRETEFLGGQRLRFSGKAQNIEKLISQVKPHMHIKIVYKFGPHRVKFR